MGKSTINGQFSIAMLVYRRVIEVQKAGRIEGPKSWNKEDFSRDFVGFCWIS